MAQARLKAVLPRRSNPAATPSPGRTPGVFRRLRRCFVAPRHCIGCITWPSDWPSDAAMYYSHQRYFYGVSGCPSPLFSFITIHKLFACLWRCACQRALGRWKCGPKAMSESFHLWAIHGIASLSMGRPLATISCLSVQALVTNNTSEFERAPALELENWVQGIQ